MYDEPLDSPFMDSDPDFREAIRLLNAAGAHTVSSCQGHAPGTQYEDVREWMDPYVTCEYTSESLIRTRNLLEWLGDTTVTVSSGKVLAKLPRGWDWKRSVASLRRKLPHLR